MGFLVIPVIMFVYYCLIAVILQWNVVAGVLFILVTLIIGGFMALAVGGTDG